jgi:hypothetical protein
MPYHSAFCAVWLTAWAIHSNMKWRFRQIGMVAAGVCPDELRLTEG